MGILKANITKTLQGASQPIAMNIGLNIQKGSFIGLYGSSGSGKTTILRILAGLEDSDSIITFCNNIWQNDNNFKKTSNRDISFVFQDYALFPNMNVEQNILFANNDKELLDKLLNITKLTRLKNAMPHNLSGGQQQRVALCRAIISKPKLLLLDEPFSALNDDLKDNLYKELKKIHNQFNFTTIIVSHNKIELFKLCSNIYHISNGEVINYDKPSNIFLEDNSELLKAIVVGKKPHLHNDNYNIIITVLNKFFTISTSEKQYNNTIIGDILEFNISNYHV